MPKAGLPGVFLAAALLLSGCGISRETETTPSSSASAVPLQASSPEYAMWWSYRDVERDLQNKTEEECSAAIDTALDNMQSLGINRIFVHAVSFTDAFYSSDIYPRSAYLGTTEADILGMFVEKAHARGLYVDVWINPMRSVTVEEVASLPEDSQILAWIQENNERVRQVNGRYYLNPAYTECQDLILSVIQEILDKYDVDGIHMDDYFYPEGTENKFDAYIYSQALAENPDLSLADFRRQNVDTLVARIYDTVKAKDPSLVFSISPSGNNDNNHTLLYAWPEDWIAQGTVDELLPQIYWGFNHPVKPYESTLQEWVDMVKDTNVRLVPGLAAYKCGIEDAGAGDASTEWIDSTDILGRQIQMALEKGCAGAALFDYGTLFVPDTSIQENVENEIVHIKNVTLGS